MELKRIKFFNYFLGLKRLKSMHSMAWINSDLFIWKKTESKLLIKNGSKESFEIKIFY